MKFSDFCDMVLELQHIKWAGNSPKDISEYKLLIQDKNSCDLLAIEDVLINDKDKRVIITLGDTL